MKAEKDQPLPLSLYLRLLFFLLSLSDGLAGAGDSHRLLSFKQSLPDPDQLLNWQPTISPCNYTGVSCKKSRVSSINLSNHHLHTDFSKVAEFLLSLQTLESLVLKNANISGTISSPPKFSCTTFLHSLDLAENAISGPVSDVSTLKLCPSLAFLNLSGNSMNPFDVQLAVSVQGLASLQFLDLSYNKISGENAVSWFLSNEFPELHHLSLKGNNFSTRFPVLSGCSILEHLDLSSNKFYGDVETSFSACPKLRFLNLTNNQLTGAAPNPIGSLQFVYLKQNHFHGVFPLTSSNSCSSLLELDLSVNNFTGTLPENLAECSLLELLDVSVNNFSGEIPVETLLKLRSLRILKMSFNNFVGPVPDSLSGLVSLETLDLSSNGLSGLIPSQLCQDPRNSFKVLYLQNNLLSGVVPQSLSNCSKLASLDLSFNYLTGTIPASLGSLPQLRDVIMLLNQLSGEIPQQFIYLQSLENLILDFNFLTGSIPASLSNCTKLNWISLSNNQLSGEIPASLGRLVDLAILKLGNNSLSGRIPAELGDCKSLIWLDLNTNFLNGTIPPLLFKQSGYIDVALLTGKRYVYIKNNGSSNHCHGAGNLLEFGGVRDEELSRVSTRHSCSVGLVWRGITQPNFNHNGSMIFLDISYNKLGGGIPKEVGSMYYLFVLNLGHNELSGPIPDELGGLKNVAILDLSFNRLNGTIPQSLTSLRLGDIDLSNNNLSGKIPESAPLDTFPDYRFVNNSGLCGIPLSPCSSSANAGSRVKGKRREVSSLAGSVAMGLAFSLFCIIGVMVVVVETNKRRRREEEASMEAYIEKQSSSSGGTVWKMSAREALSVTLSTFDQKQPLQKLTFGDLVEATNGFHSDALIGSGGFGDVYKAVFKDGSVVAIKKLKNVSGQGDREFIAEMETIGRIKHRNLVPLLGYCKVGDERLLVYEYMRHGSLEGALQGAKKKKLSWGARRRVAIGAARGLAFLHHSCIPHIIHRDMKSSNVLLDHNFEARVSDFGMARNMMSVVDTHLSVSTLAGTPGYVPPEYYQSFRCSAKGDVYSYGVVLLELLTGRRPTDCPDFGDSNLVGWVKECARGKLARVFDPWLMMQHPDVDMELLQHLKIACACLDDRPWKRPTMIQVMAMLEEIAYDGDIGAGEGIEMHEMR